jgi:hypothetical protein
MKRRDFIKYSGTTLLGAYFLGSCNKEDEELKIILPQCANPKNSGLNNNSNPYRIIMNNDGNDGFSERIIKKYESENNFIEERTSPLLGESHVDAIFYCTGTTHLFSHKTFIGENFYNDFLTSIFKRGTDPLRIIIDNVRNNGKDVFFSLRMNDTHDYVYSEIFPEWKRKNYKYLVGREGDIYDHGGSRWSAMDYGFIEVRDYIFSIFEEVINNYEINGIELDFFRHPIFFKNQLTGKDATPDQIEMMTGLIRDIGSLAHQNNIRVAIRIPDSLTVCYKIGLDINTWVCSGCVDILILSGYFHLEPWSNIKKLKEVYGIQVYPCLSKSRLKYIDNTVLPDEYWRGESIIAKNSGADGIYTFNMTDPLNKLFYELGDVELMKSKKNILRENGGYYHNYWVKDCSRYSLL